MLHSELRTSHLPDNELQTPSPADRRTKIIQKIQQSQGDFPCFKTAYNCGQYNKCKLHRRIMVYNMMECSGGFSGFDCSLAWFSFAIVLFLALIARKQINENLGMSFNLLGALAAGLGLNVLIITLTGSARWGLLLGIIGVAGGGFLIGLITGSSGGGDYG